MERGQRATAPVERRGRREGDGAGGGWRVEGCETTTALVDGRGRREGAGAGGGSSVARGRLESENWFVGNASLPPPFSSYDVYT